MNVLDVDMCDYKDVIGAKHFASLSLLQAAGRLVAKK